MLESRSWLDRFGLRKIYPVFFPVALLVVLAWSCAHFLFVTHAQDWKAFGRGESYGFLSPDVMVAQGKPLINPDLSRLPALRNFLASNSEQSFSERIPDDIPTYNLDEFQKCNLYLHYLTGLAWRIFGVNWTVYRVQIIFFYCALGLVLYGLFRLGMNRPISLAATLLFMLSTNVQILAPVARDFDKGPFVLLLLLILGHMIKRPPKTAAYLLFAMLLGVVDGIGMGFRQDLTVFFPMLVAALIFVQLADKRIGLVRRGAAVALMTAWCAGRIPAHHSASMWLPRENIFSGQSWKPFRLTC